MEKINLQKRILTIAGKPAGNPVDGLPDKALAFETGISEADICRDSGIPAVCGRAGKSGGRWRLTPEFGGFANSIMKGFREAKLRLTEDEARYASEMQ